MSRTALALILLAPALFAPAPGTAATYTVDTTSNAMLGACADAVPDDCSLRGAIDKANGTAGADSIHFAIPDTDPGFQTATAHWRIVAGTDLPFISAPLTIDGYTQTGAQENTLSPDQGGSNALLKIELRGPGSGQGLFAGGATTLRGLAINHFQSALLLFAPGPHRVEGSFIGTDISGLSRDGTTTSIGIRISAPSTIGGLAPAARNVIAGNSFLGISDQSGTSTQPSTYQGNLFGLGADGSTVLPGQDNGIQLNDAAQGTLVGGDTPAARNLFGGHDFAAIYVTGNPLSGNPPDIRIQGNWFGTDWSGTQSRPNGRHPTSPSQSQPTISVFRGGRCGLRIGGLAPGEGNRIDSGAAAGVHIGTCEGAAIVGNRFSGNRIAIDLSASSGPDGASSNDADDADEGGNRMQNTPVVTLPPGFISQGGGDTVALSYVIDSTPANSSYPLTVYFYRGGCNGGGRDLIASDTYGESDAQQARAFNLVGDGNVLPLTTLAIDAAGNTSEFSPMLGDDLFVDGLETEPATFGPGRCP